MILVCANRFDATEEPYAVMRDLPYDKRSFEMVNWYNSIAVGTPDTYILVPDNFYEENKNF